MGNAGKVVQRVRARELRAEGRTLLSIAEELGVSKSSVSLWVQGVEFTPTPRSRGHPSQSPSPLSLRKREQIEQLKLDGRRRVGQLSDREFLVAGAALYAAEGAKRDGIVAFANTDPRMILFMVTWLRWVCSPDLAPLGAVVLV
jgi:transcriptional regulator with XRE-family HTH domain